MSLEGLLNEGITEIPVPGRDIIVLDCGSMEYEEALRLQETVHQERVEKNIPDTLMLVEHPHVYTAGRNATADEVAEVETLLGVTIPHVGRGGYFTYHGPGQLVGYPILRIEQRKYPKVITAVGDLCMEVAKACGVDAYSKKHESERGYQLGMGIWCGPDENPKKLGSIGFQMDRVFTDVITRKQIIVTMHGFALNVNTDLAQFHKINPCGYDPRTMTSMKQVLGRSIPMHEVKQATVKALEKSWDYQWE